MDTEALSSLPRSRKEAKELGLPKYFTGKPCANGHLTYKLTSNYKCKQCSLDWANNKLKTDPEFAAAEREKCRIRNALRYKNDPEYRARMDAHSARWGREQRRNNEEFRVRHNERTSTYKRLNPHMASERLRFRRKHDPVFAAHSTCRDRLKHAFNLGPVENDSVFGHLGYHPKDLYAHIESLFSEGMHWGNRGEWEIDHVRPVSSFPIDNLDASEVHALSNLRPVWKEANMRKGSAWEGAE